MRSGDDEFLSALMRRFTQPWMGNTACWRDVLWDDTGAKPMIRKLSSGQYRLYSRKIDPRTGKRRNLGTFKSRAAAEKHERAVQYFKRH
jgi:hypothetical protein